MRNGKGEAFFGTLFLLSVWCVIIAPALTRAQEPPSLAPVDPRFEAYQESAGMDELALGEFGLGYLPSPAFLPHLRTEEIADPSLSSPASYDLRTYGKVTPVRNQGSCGACWAFGTMASLESTLLTGEKRNFSENNLKNRHGYDSSCCAGGNTDMSTAYFARWDGPAEETDDPYNENSCSSPSFVACQKHVQDVYFIPGRSSALDNEGIKQAVMNRGAVAASMRWEDSYYSSSNAAYCYNGSSDDTNHVIAIIGWDDNYSASKFKSSPPGNGAFLIRNSWGTGWGNEGYFWISYYDTVTAYYRSAVFTAEPSSNYEEAYGFDDLGYTSSLGWTGSDTGWGANIFTAADGQSLTAVSSFFLANNSAYTLNVYTGCSASSPKSGTLACSKTGSVAYAGYHTITLDQPVPLSAGQKFSVVIKYTTPGYNYPVPIERPISGYSSGASASSGESFYSSGGSSWTDMTTAYSGTNACIKGFVGAGGSVDPPVVTSMAKLGSPFRIAVYGSNLQNGVTVKINGSLWTNVSWKNSGKIVLKGGSALKLLVPKNTPTAFTFTNPDGGETVVSFQWP